MKTPPEQWKPVIRGNDKRQSGASASVLDPEAPDLLCRALTATLNVFNFHSSPTWWSHEKNEQTFEELFA